MTQAISRYPVPELNLNPAVTQSPPALAAASMVR
jgi:hypothetical protein